MSCRCRFWRINYCWRWAGCSKYQVLHWINHCLPRGASFDGCKDEKSTCIEHYGGRVYCFEPVHARHDSDLRRSWRKLSLLTLKLSQRSLIICTPRPLTIWLWQHHISFLSLRCMRALMLAWNLPACPSWRLSPSILAFLISGSQHWSSNERFTLRTALTQRYSLVISSLNWAFVSVCLQAFDELMTLAVKRGVRILPVFTVYCELIAIHDWPMSKHPLKNIRLDSLQYLIKCNSLLLSILSIIVRSLKEELTRTWQPEASSSCISLSFRHLAGYPGTRSDHARLVGAISSKCLKILGTEIFALVGSKLHKKQQTTFMSKHEYEAG